MGIKFYPAVQLQVVLLLAKLIRTSQIMPHDRMLCQDLKKIGNHLDDPNSGG